MTSNQIKKAAVLHFARDGYEGATLANIAKDVGIKTPSIYAHFKGKDEIFLQICKDTSLYELNNVTTYLDRYKNLPLDEFLYNFLLFYKEKYEKDQHTRFLLRVSFFPPSHLYKEIMDIVYRYLGKLEEFLIPVFMSSYNKGVMHPDVSVKQATSAFLVILDGIIIEMLYGGPHKLQKRLDHSWNIYWRSISI
ncbi:TetR/AcrR family transcriptional regulator [Niallia taxi]|uniref:TetR/AcrR family transcriptional regulator n=1 Tax=Niallia taxi TaxID=2499688 RepID=UPI002E1AD5A4|nr:TetR/AcrR family transcriptional regulator [Niallia taxi]